MDKAGVGNPSFSSLVVSAVPGVIFRLKIFFYIGCMRRLVFVYNFVIKKLKKNGIIYCNLINIV